MLNLLVNWNLFYKIVVAKLIYTRLSGSLLTLDY